MNPGSTYSPTSIEEPVDAVVDTIFDAARRGQLIVCAGAGLSRAAPTDLPSGPELGKQLDDRFQGLISGYASPSAPENLIAVADAGAALEGGKNALRTEVLALADFGNADPNYGHQVIAELLCEGGVALLLLWNWDTCIERVDVVPELLQVARSRSDLDDLDQPSIAKVHGCETRKSTLLITSDDLEQPPPWTDSTIRDRVRGKTVVFIGVGDIADYAYRRLEQLRDELASGDGDEAELDVWVVSPRIRSNWADSDWARLLPDLPDERRVELSADEFLDQLARRWVREGVDELQRSTDGAVRPEVSDSLRAIRTALSSLGAARVLRWSRRAALGQRIGASVMVCDGMQQLLTAYAVLASEQDAPAIVARTSAALEIEDRRIEALITCQSAGVDRIRQRARARAEDLANQGTIGASATFLVSGVVWGTLSDDPDPDLDIAVGDTESDDVAVGTHGVRLSFVDASEMVRAA